MNSNRPRVSLTAVLAAAVLLGTAGLAAAQPPPQADELRLTNTAALQQGPVRRVAATGDDAPPADVLGSPARKMIVRSDQLLISDRVTDAGGQEMSAQRIKLKSNLDPDTQGPRDTETVRPLVHDQYPTAAGRFLDSAADKVLAFRHQSAGDNGLWTLSNISSAADQKARTIGASTTSPQMGHTYRVHLPISGAATFLKAPGGDDGSPVAGTSSDAMTDDLQWTVVAGSDPGFFRLVSLSDGLCLDALGEATNSGSPIGTFPCFENPPRNQEWSVNDLGHLVNRNSGLAAHFPGVPGDSLTLVQTTDSSTARDLHVTFTETTEPQGVVPTVSFDGYHDKPTPYDLAVGDLDRQGNLDTGGYHDEAVVAWGDDHKISLRVVDYNRPVGSFTVTAPDSDLTAAIGGPDGSKPYRPGSLNVAVGDFNGDDNNEIAVTWQDISSAFHVAFLSYTIVAGQPKLTVVQSDQQLLSQLADAPTPQRTSGMADLIAGDFDGTGRDSLALGFAGSQPGVAAGFIAPFLSVVRFDAHLKPVAAQWGQLAGQYVMFLADPSLYGNAAQPEWTENGIRLVPGVFDSTDADLHRRQIASVARIQTLNAALEFSGVAACCREVTRQVTVHHVTLQDPGKPNALTLSGLLGSVQLPDSGAQNRPVSLAAGGFLGQGDPGDVPVWGLAATQSERGAPNGPSYVQLIGVDSADRVLTRPYRTPDLGDRQYTLTSYDYAGESLMLGAPTLFTYENMPRATVIAAQPPAHADWLNGAFVNVSRKPELNVSMSTTDQKGFSSTRTDSAGRTIGVGQHTSFKFGLEVGIPEVFDGTAGVKIGQKMDKEWDSENKQIDSNSHDRETKVTSSTADDDIVSGETKTTYIYRYPILNQKMLNADGTPYTDPSCPQGCFGQFEVSLPGAVVPGNFGGKDADWYSPTWQNGNALSYPEAGAKNLYPEGDLGSYSYIDDNDTTQTKSGLLFDSLNSLGGVKHTAELNITDTVGGGHDRKTTTTLANSAYLDFYQKVKVLDVVKFAGEEGTDYSDKTTHANIAVGETTSATANAFALEIPQVESDQSYQVRTAYYYDKSGAQKVIHGADLTSSTQGRQWWQQNYGQNPDPALNLPFATVTVKNGVGVYDDLKWNAGATRQKIRGFSVLDDQGQVTRKNPVAGSTVRFQVQVHNFSLKAAGATPVRWFAVPVDDQGLSVTGAPQAFGDTRTVSAVSARGMVTLTSPDWTAKASTGDDQHWRIFVQLDPDGSLTEIHPLAGPTCPDEAVTDGKAMVDPMTGQEEKLACGQNNQGYGEVVVSPNLPGADESPVPDLDGSTLVSGSQPLLGASPAALPQVVVGQPLTGVVKAKSAGPSRDYQPVVIYDGDPEHGGQGVASTTMKGVAAGRGYATFSWTPKTPGVHVLHQKLVGRTAAEGRSEQTLTVNVVAHGDATSIAMLPESSATTPGRPVALSVKAYDAQHNLVDDVTASSALTISPDGSCTATACTPTATGAHTITATHNGMTATTEVEVNAPVATTVAITNGNYQTAAPGKRFAKPMAATVQDQYGHPLAGQKVDFTVTTGSARFGKVSTRSVTSDTQGVATAPALTAGTSIGPVAVQAEAGSASALFVAAVAAEPVAPADLATKVRAPAKVKVGTTFTTKVTVSNRGPGVASDVLLAVSVPDRLSIRSDGPGHRVGNVVLYRISSVKAERHRTFTLKLRGGSTGKAKIVTTTMSTAPDPHRGNNTSSDTVHVRR